MLWFFIRCRGQPPRIFLRDDYIGLSEPEKTQLELAYKNVIVELLGIPRPNRHGKFEPEGVKTISFPVWKGFTFPIDLKSKLIEGLEKILHPAKGIPSGLEIVGYNNLP